ncbi:MAG TPA: hypothetical protein P5081_17145 [Phycisphaerae bacterium]|nr:hypothetical protein [Phycisphaerae bacterium]HRW54600.1 hypothetical protein [Phycisphaerae bacterium]
MKKTVFDFDIMLVGDDLSVVRSPMIDSVASIDGVCAVAVETDGRAFPCLQIEVEFEDSKSAIRLHRKIGRALEKLDGFRIVGAGTMLTDIFDD